MSKTIDQRQRKIRHQLNLRRNQRVAATKKTLKQKAWEHCSRYIRLRDALDYCKRMRIDTSQFNSIKDLPVQCCTCERVKSWSRMDAGHFKGRGLGGGSGAYFDERNINSQCKRCNAFEGGRQLEYRQFILKKYGQQVIDQLEIKHRTVTKQSDLGLIALASFYKGAYDELS